MSLPSDSRTQALAEEFGHVLASVDIIADPAQIASYTTGWSGEFFSTTRLVLRPSTTEEVSAIVRICSSHHIPIFIQGGNTGLAEGSVPDRPDSVLISLTKMNRIRHVDPIARRMTVDAGVTLAEVQERASDQGLRYAVDLAARDTATIGGTIATNAGGIRVVADGMTRDNIIGIEAVLADGTVVSHLRGLAKDNTGYSLTHLLAGSEGTLAVITGATLILKEPISNSVVVTFGTDTLARAVESIQQIMKKSHVLAAEFIDHRSLDDVEMQFGMRGPTAPTGGYAILLELSEVVEEIPEDAVVAVDARSARELWGVREHVGIAIRQGRETAGCDIALSLTYLDDLLHAVRHNLLENGAEVELRAFGHLLDGNIHLLLVSDSPIPADLPHTILEMVANRDGSISAEHGIGRIKVDLLPINRSAADIAAMKKIKDGLDPRGILNPGVLLASGDDRPS